MTSQIKYEPPGKRQITPDKAQILRVAHKALHDTHTNTHTHISDLVSYHVPFAHCVSLNSLDTPTFGSLHFFSLNALSSYFYLSHLLQILLKCQPLEIHSVKVTKIINTLHFPSPFLLLFCPQHLYHSTHTGLHFKAFIVCLILLE